MSLFCAVRKRVSIIRLIFVKSQDVDVSRLLVYVLSEVFVDAGMNVGVMKIMMITVMMMIRSNGYRSVVL